MERVFLYLKAVVQDDMVDSEGGRGSKGLFCKGKKVFAGRPWLNLCCKQHP